MLPEGDPGINGVTYRIAFTNAWPSRLRRGNGRVDNSRRRGRPRRVGWPRRPAVALHRLGADRGGSHDRGKHYFSKGILPTELAGAKERHVGRLLPEPSPTSWAMVRSVSLAGIVSPS